MSEKEIIVTNGYFNNLRLFGANSTIKVPAAAKRDDPTPYKPSYGLKLYFAQWDEYGQWVEDNIGIYSSRHVEAIPQISGRFSSDPVVFTPEEIEGQSLLQVIRDILPLKPGGYPNQEGDLPATNITDPEFDGNPPNADDSPYLMNLTLGSYGNVVPNNPNNPNYPNIKVRFEGHESTSYEFEEDGTILIHWEGESWMYYVGDPNINIPESPPVQGPADPHYPGYPTRLIYQFVFTEPQDNTTGESIPYPYPGTDSGDTDYTTNKWITTSKLMDKFNKDDEIYPNGPAKYLPITLSWERLAFDYEVRAREVKGVNRPVIVIKNLKRFGR